MKRKRKTEWSFLRVNIFILTLAASGVLVGNVIFSNLPPRGLLHTTASPGTPSPFFGGFRPENRVVIVPNAYAELKDEPIYFSMAIPPFFHSATVRLEYQNLGQPVMELGARSSLEEWAFMLKPIEADTDALEGLVLREGFLEELASTPRPKMTSDGWSVSETTFELGPLAVDAHGDLQMVVSLPGMKLHDAPVRIRSIEIDYMRPPLSLTSILKATRNRIAL